MFDTSIFLKSITVIEIENPPQLVQITEQDGIFFDRDGTEDRRIRKYVYDMLVAARRNLPKNYNFSLTDAYRPLKRQIELWNLEQAQIKLKKPGLSREEYDELTNVFVANPYKQGSGHQTGAAIDLCLIDDDGNNYDMGGLLDDTAGNPDIAATDCPFITDAAKANRKILKNALTRVGFVNYPPEWWHYSFGDHYWAALTGSNIAIFGKLDL